MSYIYSQISTKFTANMSHDKQDAIEVDIRPDKILLIKWGEVVLIPPLPCTSEG